MKAPLSRKLRVGVLASGRGTAGEGLLRTAAANQLAAEVALVLTDRGDAPVLERAAKYGVPARYLNAGGFGREAYDDEVTAQLRAAEIDLVLMAGYMRIVSPGFVDAWRGRLLNVHPSLLPAFAGLMDLRVHAAVLASGVAETGCSIHQVTEQVDAGEIVLQKRCAVLPEDTPETLKTRVQALEQEAFVEVVQGWARSAAEDDPTGLADGSRAKGLRIGLVMGSRSDWPTLEAAAEILEALGIPHEAEVVSAHRTPEKMFNYARNARAQGLQVIIAAAGGAAHLPGMIAALTPLPVLGVPVQSNALNGLDSLLSMVQMPGGVPVATFAIGTAGAKNAALFAASLLALNDTALAERVDEFRRRQTEAVLAEPHFRKPEPRA